MGSLLSLKDLSLAEQYMYGFCGGKVGKDNLIKGENNLGEDKGVHFRSI